MLFVRISGLYFFLAAALASAQDYPRNYFGSPVDTPYTLSGTFGEIRTDHFHTGFDFTTGKETGRPVYAAADGYVSRIRISAGGYGKALYITHPNGYVTVYGHLENFDGVIEKYIRKIQYRKESFEVDELIEKNRLKVRKGAVIGRSGNSGSSTGPHLHFEIRDEKTEEPINPFLFGFAIEDTVKPEIKSVRIFPIQRQGVVIDSEWPRSYEVVRSGSDQSLSVEGYIQVYGRIGFEVAVSDYQNNHDSELGIYAIDLALDTQQIFSYRYDRLNFSDARYVNARIDYEARYDNEGTFERCFRLPGDKLKIYGDTLSSGLVDFLEDGAHDVTITVQDFNGNISKLNFQLLAYSTLSATFTRPQPEDFFAMVPDKGLAIHKSELEIAIPAYAIYETILFTAVQESSKPGYFSPTHVIGDPHIPLHLPLTVSIKPRGLPDSLRRKAMIVSFNRKGSPVFEGNTWNNEFLSAKAKRFGSFAIAVDTIPPAIQLVTIPDQPQSDNQLQVRISDDLSGIKSYRATLDGKWLLMEYDAKNNLLSAPETFPEKGRTKNLLITVSDAVGNTSVFEQAIGY